MVALSGNFEERYAVTFHLAGDHALCEVDERNSNPRKIDRTASVRKAQSDFDSARAITANTLQTIKGLQRQVWRTSCARTRRSGVGYQLSLVVIHLFGHGA
jgi:hypothetical protein